MTFEKVEQNQIKGLSDSLAAKADLNGNLAENFNANNVVLNSINGVESSNIVTGLDEVSWTGDIDGINTVFELDNSYNSIFIFLNGVYYSPDDYVLSETLVTFNEDSIPEIGWDLKIYAPKGIFGLNNPLILNTEEDYVIIKQISDSTSYNYSLPSNSVGNSIDVINYSSNILTIACYGAIGNSVSVNSDVGDTILYVAVPSKYYIGQEILLINPNTGSRFEVNTVKNINTDNIELETSMIYAHYSNGDYVYDCTVLKIPAVNSDGSNNPPIIKNISSFTRLQTIASGNYQLNVLGVYI